MKDFPNDDELKILVVEDSKILNQMAMKNLEEAGFEPHSVMSGAEALAWVIENPNTLLLLDYQLPDINGNEVIEALHRREYKVPFIIMTGHGDEKLAVNMMKMGARDYLVKDSGFLEILPSVVKKVLGSIENELRLERAEEQLRESELRLNIAQKLAHVGSWEWDLADKSLIMSDEMLRIFDTKPDHAFTSIEAALDSTIHPDDRGIIQKFKGDGKPKTPGEGLSFRVSRPDGNTRWISATYPEIRKYDSNSKPKIMIGTVQDVTERKKAEKALEAANEELDSFVRTASHDLRSPLATMRAVLSLAMEMEAENVSPKGLHFFKRVEANAERMERLLNDLLMLSRAGREMTDREDIDLRDLLETIKIDMSALIDERNAQVIIPPDLPTVFGEKSAISQVFTNYMNNGLKYMGDEPEPKVEVGWSLDNGYYHFRVADLGSGIDEEHLPKVFDAFHTCDDDRAGKVDSTGVGLNIVKKVAERHGGRVWVESDGKNGSTFHFVMPTGDD